jgi:hypothetical protein
VTSRNVIEIVAEGAGDGQGWWSVSYATDDGHLGTVIIEAGSAAGALDECRRRGLQPDTGDTELEVMVMGPLPASKLPPGSEGFLNRLLQREHVEAWDEIVLRDLAAKGAAFRGACRSALAIGVPPQTLRDLLEDEVRKADGR